MEGVGSWDFFIFESDSLILFCLPIPIPLNLMALLVLQFQCSPGDRATWPA